MIVTVLAAIRIKPREPYPPLQNPADLPGLRRILRLRFCDLPVTPIRQLDLYAGSLSNGASMVNSSGRPVMFG